MAGPAVRVGVTLPQFTDDPGRFLDAAQSAAGLGYDSLWCFDHLWPLAGGKERPILECWTSLAYLASATGNIQLGSLVTRSSLRNPVLLGHMIATVSAIAPGRLIGALGSGDARSRAENEAFGIPYYAGAGRVAQLRSTLETARSWAGGDARLWLAGRSPGVLDAAAQLADGWNAWGGSPEAFARSCAYVRSAAGGRDIELSWAGLVLLAASDREAADKLARRSPDDYVAGGPDTIARRLGAMMGAGARHLVITFPDSSPDAYELFATRVRPLLAACDVT